MCTTELSLFLYYFLFVNFREPNVKRTICKRCGLILKPGISAELNINLEVNKRRVCEIRCLKCFAVKRFVMNPKYDLWLDDERSVVGVFQPNLRAGSISETTCKKDDGKNSWFLKLPLCLVHKRYLRTNKIKTTFLVQYCVIVTFTNKSEGRE